MNASKARPDFVVFTGDLTHTTDDDALRRKRMAEFKAIVSELRVPKTYFLPGEHDASLDKGQAYQEHFGVAAPDASSTRASTSSPWTTCPTPRGAVGDTQIDWLKSELGKLDQRRAHRRPRPPAALRPLPPVGLGDRRRGEGALGARALPPPHGVLRAHPPGEPPDDRAHRAPLGEVAHVPAARAGKRPQAGAGPVGSAAPRPRARLPRGGRDGQVARRSPSRSTTCTGRGCEGAGHRPRPRASSPAPRPPRTAPRVIQITAKKFEFSPAEIHLKRGEHVVLELTSLDRKHGFKLPELGIRADVPAGRDDPRRDDAGEGRPLPVRLRRVLRRRARRHDGDPHRRPLTLRGTAARFLAGCTRGGVFPTTVRSGPQLGPGPPRSLRGDPTNPPGPVLEVRPRPWGWPRRAAGWD